MRRTATALRLGYWPAAGSNRAFGIRRRIRRSGCPASTRTAAHVPQDGMLPYRLPVVPPIFLLFLAAGAVGAVGNAGGSAFVMRAAAEVPWSSEAGTDLRT